MPKPLYLVLYSPLPMLPLFFKMSKRTNISCSNWPIQDSQGKVQTGQAIVFGLGSMFNHHGTAQNVGWDRDIANLVIVYKALRDIEIGEELCEPDHPRALCLCTCAIVTP
jgi:hypothetical protein